MHWENLFQREEWFNFEELTCKTEEDSFQAVGYVLIYFGFLNNNYNEIYCTIDDKIPEQKIGKESYISGEKKKEKKATQKSITKLLWFAGKGSAGLL